MRTVVSYPGVMPAATQVARAFLEAGTLARFETTFAHLPDSQLGRALSAVSGFGAMGRVAAQMERRSLDGIPASRVRRQPTWEVLRSAAGAAGAGDVVTDRLWERTMLRFDAGVAENLGSSDGAVYGYEHACRATFARARELGVRTIFDLASPHYAFMDALLATEVAARPETATDHWRATRPLARERNAHKQAELDAAELVIANSRFTARTLTETGYPATRVRVVPLGAPTPDARWRNLPASSHARLLFAGTVSVRKGAHQLLDAWHALGAGGEAELSIAGHWALPDARRDGLPDSVRVLGSIPREQLYDLYRASSVLVFPSLCDGFGMVVTEALAHGLPVITTDHVGAADLIEDGVNGWVLPAGNVDALTERLQWCIEHPDELRAMRPAAEATAARHGWADYRRRLVETVHSYFGIAGGTR